MESFRCGCKTLRMRVNLTAQSCSPSFSRAASIALSLTIRPACGVPGDYSLATNSAALIRLLDRGTDLPTSVLRRFEGEMRSSSTAKLLGVEMSEQLLTDIGYFID